MGTLAQYLLSLFKNASRNPEDEPLFCRLFEIELSRHNWSELRSHNGSSEKIPQILRELIYAQSEASAWMAYLELENYVVNGGSLFVSSKMVVQAVLAALADGKCSKPSRSMMLELLFQILRSTTDFSEALHGVAQIENDCISLTREGIWLIYKELVDYDELPLEILKIVDPDSTRLISFSKAMKTNNE